MMEQKESLRVLNAHGLHAPLRQAGLDLLPQRLDRRGVAPADRLRLHSPY